eukprot:13520709-Alexandrium_andersonii.AAC.1
MSSSWLGAQPSIDLAEILSRRSTGAQVARRGQERTRECGFAESGQCCAQSGVGANLAPRETS